MEILEQLSNNQVVQLFSTLFGLVGISLAILFHIKSRRQKKPCFQVENKILIDGLKSELDGLEVLFNKVPQERITVSKVAFWNAGNETIDITDIANADPLKIRFSAGADLLDFKVVYQSVDSNQFSIEQVQDSGDDNDDKVYRISFDYIDKDEGAVFQIVHTGNMAHEISLLGKIKGISSMIRYFSPRPTPLEEKFYGAELPRIFRERTSLTAVLLLVSVAFYGIYIIVENNNWLFGLILAIFGFTVGAAMYITQIKRNIPSDLMKHLL